MLLTRRQFFQTSALAAASSRSPERVLVVVQLAGGNDGLNTVIPYEDDQYGHNRTTLRLAANEVRKIGSGLGFHPVLRDFERLFNDRKLSVVQGVGYQSMHRDHNVGMRIWQTATPESNTEQSGWLGRAADQAGDISSGVVPAVFVGNIPLPLSIHARQTIVPSVHALGDWTFPGMPTAPAASPDPRYPLLSFAAQTTARAIEDAHKVAAVSRAGNAWKYPALSLAQSLSTVAGLIRADIGIRIYLVEHGGVSPGEFDNHANQAGNHAVSLKELSESFGAFCDDMARDGLLDRVLMMTYSEFGRTLSENGRHGTGHGAAAPVFIAGGKLKGGLIGAHPSLSDLDNDAPKPHTDFRSLYATALEQWLGMPSAKILGKQFPFVEMLAAG